MRYVAPSGAPIRSRDLWNWWRLHRAEADPRARLGRLLADRFAVPAAFTLSTGRAAMVVALAALRARSDGRRTEVVIPSYTCYSVAASVVKAGLTPRLADVRPDTLDFDDAVGRMDHSRTLAIIATNLFGYPSDFGRLRAIAAATGALLIDDAAQALGADDGGQPVGGRGDIGILSFDKGKNVSAMACGAILCAASTADSVRSQVALLAAPRRLEEWSLVAKAVAYAGLLPPSVYWIPNGVPWLGLGQTVYTLDYPLELSTAHAASLAATMLPREPEFTEGRRANAAVLMAALRGVPGVSLVEARPGTRPAYLRLPVLLDDAELRQRVIVELNRAGIGATASYPTSLADIPDLRTALAADASSGGRDVARRIATLPTHPFVTARDLEHTVAIVTRVCAAHHRAPHASRPSRSLA